VTGHVAVISACWAAYQWTTIKRLYIGSRLLSAATLVWT